MITLSREEKIAILYALAFCLKKDTTLPQDAPGVLSRRDLEFAHAAIVAGANLQGSEKPKIQEAKELINPDRSGGVSRFELEKAYKLLEELDPK